MLRKLINPKSLAGIVVIALLLVSAVGAMAAEGDPFTITGVLTDQTSGTPDVWEVGGQEVNVITDTTVCLDPSDLYTLGVSFTCANIDKATEPLLQVSGVEAADGTLDALSIIVVALSDIGTNVYTGILDSITPGVWIVDGIGFDVSGIDEAAMPEFVTVGDEVQVTFTVSTGVNVATAVEVVAHNGEYTYTGKLTGFTETTWTVGDYTFTLGPDVQLPPYFGEGDMVEVTFVFNGEEMVATSVNVTETYVASKVESARCDNRLKDHPAILKLAASVGESDPGVILKLFCDGFGIGEIKLAYKYAQGSEYTPAMLLALRSEGRGWGEVKKIAASKPYVDDSTEGSETKVKTEKPGKPETTGKPEKPDKPDKPAKPEKDDKSNNGKAKGKNK